MQVTHADIATVSSLVEAGYRYACQMRQAADGNHAALAQAAMGFASLEAEHWQPTIRALARDLDGINAVHNLGPARVGAVEDSNWHRLAESLLLPIVAALGHDERIQRTADLPAAERPTNGAQFILRPKATRKIHFDSQQLTSDESWPATRAVLLGIPDFDLRAVQAKVRQECSLLMAALRTAHEMQPDATGQASGRPPKPPQKKRGGQIKYNPHADQRIADAWKSGRYNTYADLARQMESTEDQVRKAIDRCRKR